MSSDDEKSMTELIAENLEKSTEDRRRSLKYDLKRSISNSFELDDDDIEEFAEEIVAESVEIEPPIYGVEPPLKIKLRKYISALRKTLRSRSRRIFERFEQSQQKNTKGQEWYQFSAGGTGGRSTKPGNIKYQPEKVIEIVSSGAITVGSAASMPILAPFAAIVLWSSIWRGFSIEVSPETAFVYYVIFENSEKGDLISREEMPELVKETLQEEEIELHITRNDINKGISELKRIDSLVVEQIDQVEHYRGRERCSKKWGSDRLRYMKNDEKKSAEGK